MDIYQESLAYHAAKPNGKFSVEPTKPMNTQHDLSLAYSPGVAQPCLEIEKGLWIFQGYFKIGTGGVKRWN